MGAERQYYLSRTDIQKNISLDNFDLKKVINVLNKIDSQHHTGAENSILYKNEIDLFEIIYDYWEVNEWVQTDRYELSEKLVPMAAELQDYELLLIFFVYSTIESGSEGDIGVSIAQYAPLLTLYDKIMELLVAFEYILHQEKEDDQWIDDYRITCQKNLQGEVTEVRFQSYEDTYWMDLLYVTLTNKGGHIETAIIQAISEESPVLRNIIKMDIAYASDVPISLKFNEWDTESNEWMLFVQLIYSYSNSLLDNILIQYSPAADHNWIDIYKILYSYDELQRLILQISQSADLSEISPQLNKAQEGLELVNNY